MTEPAPEAEATAPRTGKMVVISGPSGTGKTTVCHRLLEDPDVTLSVSATTRSRRSGEEDGVHYHFLDRDRFLARVGRGDFAEYAEYNGHLYGTPRGPLEEALAKGRTVLLDIDVQGAAQLRKLYPQAVYIFLDAPDRAAAQARLERRNTETPEERCRRINAAERERAVGRDHFDYHVINDDLDETVDQIRSLISGGDAGGTSL